MVRLFCRHCFGMALCGRRLPYRWLEGPSYLRF